MANQTMTQLISQKSRQLVNEAKNAEKLSNSVKAASRDITSKAKKIKETVDKYNSTRPAGFPAFVLDPVAQAAVDALPEDTGNTKAKSTKAKPVTSSTTDTGTDSSDDNSSSEDTSTDFAGSDTASTSSTSGNKGRHSFLNF